MAEARITGGCQCGAVRYALHAEPTGPHICHCRMCQKAFGSFFAPFTSVPLDKFAITRGELAIFKSSDPTQRGFCKDCGTPLTIHDVGSKKMSVSIGSLDEPEKFPPRKQVGIEGKLPWFDKLPGLPGDKTTEADNPELVAKIAASNHQHPDHDTAVWPPREGTMMAEARVTGGCQCGAVRYEARSLKDNSHVCHCRMCQKASGNFFAALVGVPLVDFSWTRGAAGAFKSSEHVERGFCRDCGTPLFFRHDRSQHISMTIGSFDHPEMIPLAFQLGMEARLPQVDQLASLKDYGTTEDADPNGAAEIRVTNHQHPDHDTAVWPPRRT